MHVYLLEYQSGYDAGFVESVFTNYRKALKYLWASEPNSKNYTRMRISEAEVTWYDGNWTNWTITKREVE